MRGWIDYSSTLPGVQGLPDAQLCIANTTEADAFIAPNEPKSVDTSGVVAANEKAHNPSPEADDTMSSVSVNRGILPRRN